MADRPIDLPVEILLCILDNIQTVTVGDVTHTRERDLASSALVCKLWNEVATECLWRELPSALCLLCLLGEMTYGEPDGWNYTTAINKPNADRFRHLATRALRLSHSNATRWKMAESSRINIEAIQAAFSWFSLQTHCDTLLPRVKTISWAAHDSYPSSQLPYFISSCLQSLSFTRISFWLYENPRGELERGIDIFTSLIKKQCQLKHLVFGIPWSLFDSSALKATYLEFASTQTRLRSIDIRDWIDESLVRSMVGASTTLVSLGCWVRGGEVGTFGRTIYALSTGFDVLRDLNLYVTGGEVTDEDFKQFMQLRSLRRITLSTLGFPRLEEADVEAMSRAWSDIEEFVVKQRGFVAANPHRLSILSAFARWMGSNLQILELDLDATAEPPPVAADSFKFVKLRELRIGQLSRAPPDPDEAVTEYLRSLSLGGQSSFKLVVGVSVFDAVDGWRKVRSSFERGNIGVEEAN